jgi:hypothetical protein
LKKCLDDAIEDCIQDNQWYIFVLIIKFVNKYILKNELCSSSIGFYSDFSWFSTVDDLILGGFYDAYSLALTLEIDLLFRLIIKVSNQFSRFCLLRYREYIKSIAIPIVGFKKSMFWQIISSMFFTIVTQKIYFTFILYGEIFTMVIG